LIQDGPGPFIELIELKSLPVGPGAAADAADIGNGQQIKQIE
jgi:hypothetical protein